MSKSAAKTEQGHLQGAINGLRGAAGIVGPQIFTWIFAYSVGERAVVNLPGSPFYMAALMLLVAIPIGIFATRQVPAPA